jgi:imidazole glycerol-phosphate synthase subunit HisF
MKGYDLELTRAVVAAVSIPVVACGGAGSTADFATVTKDAGASAAAAGSLFVFQGKHRAVLINFPARAQLDAIMS